jgi:hypothetical protein
MTFSIKVLNEPEHNVFDEPCSWCQIDINDFSERFPAPIGVWDLEQYKQQWRDCIQRVSEGKEKDYLVTGMRDPKSSDFISLFVLYREGENIFIQNQIVFCEGNEVQISTMNILDLVEDRETHTDDGVQISEWKISIGELRRGFDV